jgi:hypothetical protein
VISPFYSALLLELGVTGLVLLAGGLFRHWRQVAGNVTPPSGRARRPRAARSFLRATLGLLWVLDGLLQAQPGMPAGFPGGILAPVAVGQPPWLQAVLHWEIGIWQAHPVHLAVATVLIQVGIGLAILSGGDSWWGRSALWISIGWGLAVWMFGEALGGLLAPGASLISGTPGSVLAYVAAAALLLAPADLWDSGRARRLIEMGVGATFLLGVVLQTIPGEGFWTPNGLRALFAPMASFPQPALLAEPIRILGTWAAADPLLWNCLFIFAMAVIGVGLCLFPASPPLTALAVAWTLLAWWLGQDFGALGTGVATDPNLAPLLAVLLLTAQISDHLARGPIWRARTLGNPRALRAVAMAGLAAVVIGVLGGIPYAAQATLRQGPSPAAVALER